MYNEVVIGVGDVARQLAVLDVVDIFVVSWGAALIFGCHVARTGYPCDGGRRVLQLPTIRQVVVVVASCFILVAFHQQNCVIPRHANEA